MKTIIMYLAFNTAFFIVCQNAASQFNQEWIKTYGGTGLGGDRVTAMTIDASGNVYVTGNSYANTTYGTDFVTLKYSPAGDTLWSARYMGQGNNHDVPYSIAVDAAGNVYVCGYSSPDFGYYDLTTIKYSASGSMLWMKKHPDYSGFGCSMAIDLAGNVYSTGTVPAGFQNTDIITVKYNTNGDSLWARRFDCARHHEDKAVKTKTDASGFIYLVGESPGTNTNIDFVTIKYEPVNGDSVWVARFNGTINNNEIPYDHHIDAAGNVYVTGVGATATGGDFVTVKYNSAGAQEWVSYYNFSIYDEIARAVTVDDSGNVYVTGQSRVAFTNTDYATVKYNSSGVQQWVAGFDGPAHNNDIPSAIHVDAQRNVFVAGSSYYFNASDVDLVLIKYTPDGVQHSFEHFNNNTANEGYGFMVFDSQDNIFISGESGGDYVLIKYSQTIGINNISSEIPSGFSLNQNYPNPFNPVTNIEFSVPKSAYAKLVVYDISGKEIETLLNGNLNAGTYRADWDASKYSGGVYFYRLVTSEFTQTRKMILIK